LQAKGDTIFSHVDGAAAQKSLFTCGKHFSRVENTVAPQKALFIRSTLSPSHHFITFKQASLATNLMTRCCRVFSSSFLRLLSLKGYAELFRSAAHFILPN
jgi:hypothetical protein